jgi:hypothetical protein
MINHKTKCIFIHVPRTAGTSIEVAIQNQDQWHVSRRRKHLIASTAKKIYKEYWDEYFKFAFVRNPWDRMISLCKYGNFHPREYNRTYGCDIQSGKLNLGTYRERFSTGYEVDQRSYSADDKFKPAIPNAIYSNILNEKLDFIGKFETLQSDCEFISEKIKKKIVLAKKQEQSKHLHYSEYYTDEIKDNVRTMFEYDTEVFNYEFNAQLANA